MKRMGEMMDETNNQRHGAPTASAATLRSTTPTTIAAKVLRSAIAGYQASLVGHPPGGTLKADYGGSRVDSVPQQWTSQASFWVARLSKRGKFEWPRSLAGVSMRSIFAMRGALKLRLPRGICLESKKFRDMELNRDTGAPGEVFLSDPRDDTTSGTITPSTGISWTKHSADINAIPKPPTARQGELRWRRWTQALPPESNLCT
ncbi:hypothetical protein GGI42DRAFT_275354 [Trichoderma sp. SZMC 28013]